MQTINPNHANIPKPMRDESEQLMYERWRTDKPTFARQVLNYDTLKPFQAKMMRFKGTQKLGRRIALRLLPRGSGKSWGGTIASSTHDVCIDPDTSIQIIAESMDTACMFLGETKQQLQHNEKLIYYFGNHYNPQGTWSIKKIVSGLRTKITKEPTLEAFGIETAIVGRHVPIQYFDDIVSERTSDQPAKRDKIERKYDKVILPCLDMGGEQYINGTRYFDEDFYGWLIKRFGTDIVFRIPALTQMQLPNGSIHYESYFPELHPVESLLDMRRINPVSFASQYQNDTSLLTTGIINPHLTTFIAEENWPNFDELLFYIAVDPATSLKQNADYFATCTVGYNPTINKAYIFRSTKSRIGDSDQMLQKILNEWRWVRDRGGDVVEITIESNGFQGVLANTYNNNPSEYGVLPITPKHTSKDKVSRLLTIAFWFNFGNVIIDESCVELFENLLKFPHIKNDDDVDSMILCFEALNTDATAGYSLPVSAYELGDSNAVIFGL